MKYPHKMRLLRLRLYLIPDVYKRTEYLIKKNVFASVGNNFFFQPRVIPADPKLIKFHDNVVVASNVTFINHDVINLMLNNIPDIGWFKYQSGCIEVGNNVFIGANTTILPNVKIGDNVIVSAGSVVTKDIPSNSVVGGVPAKKIMSFEEYIEKRRKKEEEIIEYDGTKAKEEEIWKLFESQRKEKI